MIGDSHLAMMVNAQRERPIANLELTPVSWPRELYNQISLRKTQLCADGPELIANWEQHGLTRQIDLERFDRVVFVSYTVTTFNVFAIMRDHINSGWNDAAFLVNKLNSWTGGPGSRRLISPAIFNECLAGVIRENHSYKFIDHVRQYSDVPIIVIPPPYLAEDTLKHRPKLWGLKQVLRENDGAALARSLHEAHENAFGSFSKVTLLRQSADSVVNGCLTKETYREGATRYGSRAAQGADDVIHAGPMLGHQYLNEISALSPE